MCATRCRLRTLRTSSPLGDTCFRRSVAHATAMSPRWFHHELGSSAEAPQLMLGSPAAICAARDHLHDGAATEPCHATGIVLSASMAARTSDPSPHGGARTPDATGAVPLEKPRGPSAARVPDPHHRDHAAGPRATVSREAPNVGAELPSAQAPTSRPLLEATSPARLAVGPALPPATRRAPRGHALEPEPEPEPWCRSGLVVTVTRDHLERRPAWRANGAPALRKSRCRGDGRPRRGRGGRGG